MCAPSAVAMYLPSHHCVGYPYASLLCCVLTDLLCCVVPCCAVVNALLRRCLWGYACHLL